MRVVTKQAHYVSKRTYECSSKCSLDVLFIFDWHLLINVERVQ